MEQEVRIIPFQVFMASDCAEVVRASIEGSHGDYYTENQIAEIVKGYSAERLIAKSQNRTMLVGLDTHGLIVSIGALRQNQIKGIYVIPSHWGNGYGGRLLDELEQVANARQLAVLELYSSLNAVGFYQRHNYHIVSPHEDINGPAMLMAKTIQRNS